MLQRFCWIKKKKKELKAKFPYKIDNTFRYYLTNVDLSVFRWLCFFFFSWHCPPGALSLPLLLCPHLPQLSTTLRFSHDLSRFLMVFPHHLIPAKLLMNDNEFVRPLLHDIFKAFCRSLDFWNMLITNDIYSGIMKEGLRDTLEQSEGAREVFNPSHSVTCQMLYST